MIEKNRASLGFQIVTDWLVSDTEKVVSEQRFARTKSALRYGDTFVRPKMEIIEVIKRQVKESLVLQR